VKKVTVAQLQKSINLYQSRKGPFRRHCPGFENWWPKVSFGMSRLIRYKNKIEDKIDSDADLINSAYTLELYKIINNLSSGDQRSLTGSIFAPISYTINSPSSHLNKTPPPEVKSDETDEQTADKPGPLDLSQQGESFSIEAVTSTVPITIVDTTTAAAADVQASTTPTAPTQTILQAKQSPAPLEKHDSPFADDKLPDPKIIPVPVLRHSHSQPNTEFALQRRRPHRSKRSSTSVITATVGTNTDESDFKIYNHVIPVDQTPQQQMQRDLHRRITRAGFFGMGMGYVGFVDSLEEGNVTGALSYGALTGLIYGAVAYRSHNNTTLMGMVSVLLSFITLNWWPPRVIAHVLGAVGVSAAVNFSNR
jgi:hypothetical protein